MSLTESFDENTDTPLTDRKQVKERAKKSQSVELRRRLTLAEMLKPPACREFFYWLLEKCHVDKTSTCVNATGFDAYGTFFNEGARSVGIALQSEMLIAAPTLYALMLSEEQERQELRKQNG